MLEKDDFARRLAVTPQAHPEFRATLKALPWMEKQQFEQRHPKRPTVLSAQGLEAILADFMGFVEMSGYARLPPTDRKFLHFQILAPLFIDCATFLVRLLALHFVISMGTFHLLFVIIEEDKLTLNQFVHFHQFRSSQEVFILDATTCPLAFARHKIPGQLF
jgi:hypothetical protein